MNIPRFQMLRLEIAEGIATLTLSRPDKLNAVDGTMLRELLAVFDYLDAEDAVRAVIVTGSGRAFCAGADLSAGPDVWQHGCGEFPDSDGSTPRDAGGILTLRIFRSRKPIVAAINGAAVGMGITMTLPMDLRLMAPAARVGFVFARRGITPESCASWFLPRLVGISKALEWTFSGALVSAPEACEAGLGQLVEEGVDVAKAARAVLSPMLSKSAPVSVSMTRRLMWQMLAAEDPMSAHIAESRALQLRASNSDAVEGTTAFLQKRAPAFRDSVDECLPPLEKLWPEPPYG